MKVAYVATLLTFVAAACGDDSSSGTSPDNHAFTMYFDKAWIQQ
jgi:hypothetical protein